MWSGKEVRMKKRAKANMHTLPATLQRHMQGKQSAYLAGISATRLFIVAVLLCVVAYTGWLNVYTTLVGLFGLKAATYLQPFIAKLLSKLNK